MQFAERQPLDRSRSDPAPTPLRTRSDHGPQNQRLTVEEQSEGSRREVGAETERYRAVEDLPLEGM